MPPEQRPYVREAPMAQGRTRRFLHLGRALGEWAVGAAAEGLVRLSQGERPNLSQLMLTPGNARRLASRLSQMRGAVMKVGQLMSMDGSGVLPPHFVQLLSGLRDRVHIMPAAQLNAVLEHEYGAHWRRRFRHFSTTPVAAASIGQVHRAQTYEGQWLALKIQYPGVRQSIASDVANLALLTRVPGLVPAALEPALLLERVKKQLLHETDYRAEARAAAEYKQRLGDDPVLMVPAVHEEHCTAHILATDFAQGVAIDCLGRAQLSQEHRDHIARALSGLAVREFFDMRLVQTDPNFGNYLYHAPTRRIALLDFGATQAVSKRLVEQLRNLGRALRDDDPARVMSAAQAAGFVGAQDPAAQAAAMVNLMRMAGEPLRHRGRYDFAGSDLMARTLDQGKSSWLGSGFARLPPPDLLFLQRKFVGTFMLCVRLHAQIDVAALFGKQF